MRGRGFSLRSPSLAIFSPPSLAGRGGSVSRRDLTQLTRNRAHLSGGTTYAEVLTPIASYSSGEGVWGRGASLREAPLPQNLRRPSHPSICVLQTVATVMVAAPMARS